jgi:hypothetical protein
MIKLTVTDRAFSPSSRAVLLAVAMLAGCGDRDDQMTVYPVRGSVTVDGKPAEGAQITLFALDEKLRGPESPLPTGRVDAEGNFIITSYEFGDGAPPGEYKVGVVWLEVIKPAGDLGQEETRDRLKEKYADPSSSTLTATVTEGTNNLPPFAL